MTDFRPIFLEAKTLASIGEVSLFFHKINTYFLETFQLKAFPNAESGSKEIQFPHDYHALIIRALEEDFLLDAPQIPFGLLFDQLMRADPCTLWLNHLRNGDFHYGMLSLEDQGVRGMQAQRSILQYSGQFTQPYSHSC